MSNIKAGPPPQSHWMIAAQDPGRTPDRLPPTAKHRWQVIRAADEHRIYKSKLQMLTLQSILESTFNKSRI